MAAIGIDLGTTNSCVAVLLNDQFEVLHNDYYNRVTPSCVAFNEHELMIGEEAMEQIAENPENTLFSVKRLIGRQFNDEKVQEDLKHLPFKVFSDLNGKPKIRVKTNQGMKDMYPEAVSGIVLSKMKKIAEERIGGKVYNAVITVPAYFNDAQRRATKAAARLAELDVLALIGEPDAAAIAYAQINKKSTKRNVLVYDLGGGTFDVTVLTIHGADVTVHATGGDTHLGGDDFNYRMLEHFVEEFEKKWGINVMQDSFARARLIQQCEVVKRTLSKLTMKKINILQLVDGKDFKSQVTRAQFEDWNEDIFSRTKEAMKKVLDDAKMSRNEINEVILVSGSTKIPYIRNMLKEYFGADKIMQTLNPDEAVAYGAAVYAAHRSGINIPGLMEAERNLAEDKKFREHSTALNDLELRACQIKRTSNSVQNKGGFTQETNELSMESSNKSLAPQVIFNGPVTINYMPTENVQGNKIMTAHNLAEKNGKIEYSAKDTQSSIAVGTSTSGVSGQKTQKEGTPREDKEITR